MKEIELDLTAANKTWLTGAGVVLAALALVLIGALGYAVTPIGSDGSPRWLTWEDWTARQVRAQVQRERDALRAEHAGLVELLRGAPDPVRAGLALDRARAMAAKGSPLLVEQRAALVTAAQAVYDWTAGVLSQPKAAAALDAAATVLNRALWADEIIRDEDVRP